MNQTDLRTTASASSRATLAIIAKLAAIVAATFAFAAFGSGTPYPQAPDGQAPHAERSLSVRGHR